ncbi:circadian clock protein KaiC [Diaphorobacter caeni]|uniref:circadian clock protein KaiC n=1 Tax=Diaphorobacter caeni TaxID=2784387 RepID=UPI00188E5BE6|nr:circadian clock protein KaiC [Diaphorobacter caeni]MBF5005870.1 circadian clock protein KaiC [Diaphorobacter caeni]
MRSNSSKKAVRPDLTLAKTPTGIRGLDEITGGGLPTGRPTLVCGAAGCGKTLLASEFVVRGAAQYKEPGAIILFEETAEELTANMRSIGYDLDAMQRKGQLAMDFIRVDPAELVEAGSYDLEGLFIRIGHAIDSVGAKRVALDTIETLFSDIANHAVLRAELRRLFRWLKERGVTAVITGERGNNALTRYGLEEYVADCVILLDHRIIDQVSTRRLRVVKYRGSAHGTNEYPFLISAHGISVLPITSLTLEHQVSNERVSTGIVGLDRMLGGAGVYRGSSLLISGSPGTGKSSVAAAFVDAACARGERAVLFAYEEACSQLVRNMQSIGIKLQRWIDKGLLRVEATRPTLQGLEQHLVQMYNHVTEFKPSVVAVDPISNLTNHQNESDLALALMRLIDFLKTEGITALFTSLNTESAGTPGSQLGVSSLMDTWLWLSNIAFNGERTRTLQVLKSRGMPHSNQVREFVFSNHGVDLIDVYMYGDQVLTGTARVAHEAQVQATTALRDRDHERRMRDLSDRRKALDAQIAALNVAEREREGQVKFDIAREKLEAEGALNRARSISAERSTVSNGRRKKQDRK